MRKNIIATLFLAFTIITCKGTTNNKKDSQLPQDTIEQKLSIIIAGDLMQHDGQIKAAARADGTYNYDDCFKYVKNELERADVAIANFEVTLAGPPYKGYPQFSAPDEYLKAAADAGFDIMLTANNHCLDGRQRGLERTIKMMDSLHIPHIGTYVNAAQREQQYPFVIEKNGIKVVVLNFTYGTNGLRVTAPNVVNYMDTTQIKRDLAKAKRMKPDCIIAIPHWGVEYTLTPTKEQERMADWLLRQGVDHVIGGHPHVPEPVELRNGKNVVAYSLGNFVSNMTRANTYGGLMVRLELAKKSKSTRLADCGYCLYWVSRKAENGKQFIVYPIDVEDSLLNATERTKRNTIRNAMRNLMKTKNKGDIKEYKF